MRALSPERVVPAFTRFFEKMNETKCGAGILAVVLGQRAWNTSAPLKGGQRRVPYQPAQVVH
eukprot:8887410-Heterocapsa_arctica.AAC.1